jgi:hypothetical protein
VTQAEGTFLNFPSVQHLRLAFQGATIEKDRTKGDAMTKKQTAKTKSTEADPLGDLMTAEFVGKAFKEAVEEAWEEQREAGLDSYGTIEGKRVAKKPDGRIVYLPEKTNG